MKSLPAQNVGQAYSAVAAVSPPPNGGRRPPLQLVLLCTRTAPFFYSRRSTSRAGRGQRGRRPPFSPGLHSFAAISISTLATIGLPSGFGVSSVDHPSGDGPAAFDARPFSRQRKRTGRSAGKPGAYRTGQHCLSHLREALWNAIAAATALRKRLRRAAQVECSRG